MRILIAGGAGYIGSALVPKLQSRGYDVDVVDILWFKSTLPATTRIIQRDVITLKEDDLKGYDTVVFLAGLSNDPMAEFSPALNFISNAISARSSRSPGRARWRHPFHSTAGLAPSTDTPSTKFMTKHPPHRQATPTAYRKLVGEFSALALSDDKFSVIGFRKRNRQRLFSAHALGSRCEHDVQARCPGQGYYR